jgi:hypothetical protein
VRRCLLHLRCCTLMHCTPFQSTLPACIPWWPMRLDCVLLSLHAALSEVARAVRAARSTRRSEQSEWPATHGRAVPHCTVLTPSQIACTSLCPLTHTPAACVHACMCSCTCASARASQVHKARLPHRTRTLYTLMSNYRVRHSKAREHAKAISHAGGAGRPDTPCADAPLGLGGRCP